MKTKVVGLRLDEDNERLLKDKAKEYGKSLSGYIVDMLTGVNTLSDDDREWAELRRMLPDVFLDMLAQKSKSKDNYAIWAAYLWGLLNDEPKEKKMDGDPYNPYYGFVLEPDVDGTPYGYDDDGIRVKRITNGKMFVLLKQGDKYYDQF